ncbi:MAG TPA: MerR family transcriptional regulator [Phycisphaerae bacterium]|nr:MerR family transcriptional regulator [Phycisphaerae bacterium]
MNKDKQQPAGEEPMRISELARATNVSKQTIEYYLMLGLLTPLRQAGRRGRFFDASHVTRIRLIRKLNASGYTLRAIRETYLSRR